MYRQQSQYNKAIATHEKALKSAKSNDNAEFSIFSLNMLGVDYRRKNIYKSAIEYNKEALEIAEKIENPNSGILRSMEESHNSIVNIYLLLKQYDLAIERFKKGIEIAEISENNWSVSINNENIAKVKEAQGNLDEAILYTKKALAIDESIDNHYGRMICYNRLGRLHIKKGAYLTAENFLKEAMPIAVSANNNYHIALVNNNLGWVNTKLKRYDKAKTFFDVSLKLAERKHYKTALIEIYSNLSEFNELVGKYKEALIYHKKQNDIASQLANKETAQYVNDLIIKYDSDKQSNQIKILSKQNEINQLQLSKNRTYWIISFVILLFVIATLYFLYRQRLLRNQKRIITLEQDVLRAQMNPHFIFNALNSIKHYIINNDQKNAVYYLNKFSKLVRKILESSKLKEVTLEEELETTALYMNIENIRFSNEISYTMIVEESLDLKKIKVPPLILQPFLENALWHGLSSKKDNKKITLTIVKPSENFIQIVIEDNGIGRKASAEIKSNKVINRKSIGIDLTKERLNNFIKNFKNPFSLIFDDLVDNHGIALGTKITLEIPLI